MYNLIIDKDPKDTGRTIFSKGEVNLKPGVTVLVGCNGYGKSTLLRAIERDVKDKDYPCVIYDNVHDGGSNGLSNALFDNDIQLFASAAFSSEGEHIICFFQRVARQIGAMIKQHPDSKSYWVLLDGVDSGLSVNNIEEHIDFLHFVVAHNKKTNPNKEIYIVASANSYAMCETSQCYDLYNDEYLTFKTYKDYVQYIYETQKRKNGE